MSEKSRAAFLPGSTIGIFGGGQLGRMFGIAARRMGYRLHVFSPDEDSPTGQLADVEVAAQFEDDAAVTKFARGIDVLTFEFENIPADAIGTAARECVVRPAGRVLYVTRDRLREKNFLLQAGLPLTPFERVTGFDELRAAVKMLGLPAVLKSAAFGYDGKGQQKVADGDDLGHAWSAYAGTTAVLEKFVPFAMELAVVVARGVDGQVEPFPVSENIHRNHILDVSVVPARVTHCVADAARELAVTVAEKLDLVGVMGVEMFLLKDDSLLINELAPRPHNSGHFSFDACVTSQFEQQLRAVCGLPLGSTELLRPVAMANLLGDLWETGEPDWTAAAAFPDVKIHLYGKTDAHKGRKMGHLVAFGNTATEAAAKAVAARQALTR